MTFNPIEPWDWPQDWFKKFIKMRATSKTYVKIDEFSSTKKRWMNIIFNRHLFWHTIKLSKFSDSITMEMFNWLCKDNTKSKWTLSLTCYPLAHDGLIYTFYFKDKNDLLLFKMKW